MGALARASTDSERLEATERLSAGVQRAIRLVEQLLSLSRQESRAEPARVPVALDPMAREVVTELLPVSDAKHIDLGISESQPVAVLGDPDALHTLLRNLVDNAVRYTPPGGQVDLAVQQNAGSAVLKVVDTGPGIPPEDRSRVFDRFYRRPGSSPPGSGLGLAIVKSIAEAHMATVTLGSGPTGTGLAVTVTFPAAPSRSS
jgi:two-component system OmpR family sensor kinase